MAEWDVRQIDAVWDEYTRAMEELGASGVCDVFAIRPGQDRRSGARFPDEFYDRITEAAVRSGMAAELSSAGWRKPSVRSIPRRPSSSGSSGPGSADHRLGRPYPPDVADRADDLRGLLQTAGVDHLQGYRTGAPPGARARSGRYLIVSTAPSWPSNAPHSTTSSSPTSSACWAPGDLADSRSRTWCCWPDGAGRPGAQRDRPRAGDPRSDAPVQQRHGRPGRPGGPTGRCRRLAARRAGLRDREVTRGECCWTGRGAGPAPLHPGALRGHDRRRAGPAGRRRRRRPGHLERTYRDLFDRFAVMLSESTFPFPARRWHRGGPEGGDGSSSSTRRDGPLRVAQRHQCVAPDGHVLQIEGRRLTDSASRSRPSSGRWPPRSRCEEVERRPDVTVLLHCIPCWPRRRSPGAWCCCATSPTSGGSTGCCCRRTQRSARCTIG